MHHILRDFQDCSEFQRCMQESIEMEDREIREYQIFFARESKNELNELVNSVTENNSEI